MFSGRVVVEVSNRLVSVLPATKVSCWPQFVLRDEGEADGGLVSQWVATAHGWETGYRAAFGVAGVAEILCVMVALPFLLRLRRSGLTT